MSKVLKLPMREQKYDFDCSISAAWSYLKYHKINVDYNELLEASKISPVNGLHPQKLVTLLKKFGLNTILLEHQNIRFLKKQINLEIPVIILMQYRKEYKKSWKNSWNYGHYGIIFGCNDRTCLMYDPWNGEAKKFTYVQLNNRWHDKRDDDNIFIKTVITI
jgi:ABC-type bacteriocin/lantibiotic exporter with double-glycine peptidase domain